MTSIFSSIQNSTSASLITDTAVPSQLFIFHGVYKRVDNSQPTQQQYFKDTRGHHQDSLHRYIIQDNFNHNPDDHTGGCSCPSTFYGPKCEFAVGEINMDKVDAEVGMEVSVNQEFSPDLNDNSSQVYKDFTKAFQDQIKKIYQNVQGFKEVQILSLRMIGIYREVGQCILQESGPSCRCFSTDTHWFLGPRCEVAISWKPLVGGLAGAGALLLLLLVALSVFVVRSRRRDRQGRGRSRDDRKWFETWDENTAGTFSNSGFEDDINEENFPVALDTVDTDARVGTDALCILGPPTGAP
nr:PREDICTED: mucin-3B-like [Bos mutus]